MENNEKFALANDGDLGTSGTPYFEPALLSKATKQSADASIAYEVLAEPLSETFPLTTEVFKNAMAQTIETAKSVRKAFNDPETLGNLNTQLAEKGEQIDLQAVDSAIAAMEAEFADEQEENLTGEEVEVQTDLMTFQMVVALKEELDAVKAQLADLEIRIVQHNVRASHKL